MYIFLASSLLMSCSEQMNDQEWISWYNENNENLERKVSSNGYTYFLKFHPNELTYISNIQQSNNDANQIDTISFENLVFSLGVQHSEFGDALNVSSQKANNILYYVESGLPQDMVLINETDTNYCILAHLENYHGLKPRNVIDLIFQNSSGRDSYENGFKIQFHDNLFSNSLIEFEFNGEVLSQIPPLKKSSIQ